MVWYGLATYRAGKTTRPAIVLDGKIHDLADAYSRTYPRRRAAPAWVSAGLDALIADWDALAGELDAFAEAASGRAASGGLTVLRGAMGKLAMPIRPRRIFGAAANYIEHANEMASVLAKKSESNPYFFMKAETSAIGPGETVHIPPESKKVDWEVELGAIIGRTARRVPLSRALDHVAAYTVTNDVSARDLNSRTDFPFKFDWFQGKSHDTFAPIGPWIVPKSCIRNPQKLPLSLAVNDEMMQDSDTGSMIFNVREQIAYLSTIVTLMPGDVLMTGTPAGVGAGRGIFLKPGDVMTASIGSIGTLVNPVAAEHKRRR